MLAARWNLFTDIWLENKESMILVRYEDFQKDKIEEISNLSKVLGLKDINDISSKINIQYQPKGNQEISWDKFFGLDNLASIERLCSERMKLVGYPSL